MSTTYAFINGKGGSGKTTTALVTGLALTSIGRTVSLVDLDPQSTATRCVRESDGAIPLPINESGADITLVDTPPRLDSVMFSRALNMADVLIVVTTPSPADLFASEDTIKLIRRHQRERDTFLLFNQVQPRTALSQQISERSEQLGVRALTTFFTRRQAYQHSLILGWKGMPPPVRDEALRVALEIATMPRK
jgi:chromosome partitioning protein